MSNRSRTCRRSRLAPTAGLLVLVLASTGLGCGGGGPLDSDPEPATGGIHGVVTGDGAPRSGVTVTLTTREGSGVATSVTDGNGEYGFFDLAPGPYTVLISDFASMRCENVRTATVVAGEGTEVRFTCAKPSPEGTVAGRVMVNGVGAGSVVVSLREGSRTRTTSTDDSGLYRFSEVPVGLKIVQIRSDEESCPTTSQEVTVTADGTAAADFACTGQVVTGRVTVNGIPEPDVGVDVCQPVDWDFGLLCQTPSDATDSEGWYAYTSFPGVAFQEDWYDPEGLGPGDYLVFVAGAPGGVTCQAPRSISVAAGETVTVDIACVRDSTGHSGEGEWDY